VVEYHLPFKNNANCTSIAGYQEVVENNIAEFNKVLNSKDGKTEELWTIVESMIWWMVEEPHAPWHMIDDGERSVMTHSLLGFMFLTVLNRIDQDGDLKPDSKYLDLSRVMALWAKASEDLGTNMDEDPLADNKGDLGDYAGFNQVWFRYLLALSKESGVPIEGVTDIENDIDDWHAQAEGKVKLPPKKVDRFGWKTKVGDSLSAMQNHPLRHAHSIRSIPRSTDTVVKLVETHSKSPIGRARRGNRTPTTRKIP